MGDEAMARRVARVSGICFEASSGRLSEGRYESRLSMARRCDFDCAEGDSRSFRYTELVLQSDQRNG